MIATKSIGQGLANIFDVGNVICNSVENLEKVAKIGFRSIDCIQIILGTASKGFKALSSQLKGSYEFFEAIHIFGRFGELIFPDANGNSFFKVNSWQKSVDRVSLTAHSTLKTINYGAQLGLITLGRVALVSIGSLAVLKLATDGFLVVSNFFGLWDTKNKYSDISKKMSEANSKLDKWEHRPELLAMVRAGKADALKQLESTYRTKNSSAAEELKRLEAYSAKDEQDQIKTTQKINALKVRIGRYEGRLENILAGNHEKLAEDLSKTDRAFKLKKWEVVKKNQNMGFTKIFLNVVKSVTKIAVVVLATVFTMCNWWTVPLILTVGALSITSDSFGLTKNLYEHYKKPLKVPTAPQIAIES